MKRLTALAAMLFVVAASSASAHSFTARQLSDGHVGADTNELVAQHFYSLHAIAFFTTGRHRWMRAPHRESCWKFEGRSRRHVCDRARRSLAANRWLLATANARMPAETVIDLVFGAEAAYARTVAWCESKFSVYAHNGQYHGVFQMGDSERATYGGSSLDPWDQVTAAKRYRVAAHGWGPWACA